MLTELAHKLNYELDIEKADCDATGWKFQMPKEAKIEFESFKTYLQMPVSG